MDTDAAELVLSGLAAGAAAGFKSAASAAVNDAYVQLKELLARHFRGGVAAEVALREHEVEPKIWMLPVQRYLQQLELSEKEVSQLLSLARVVVDGGAEGQTTIVNVNAHAIDRSQVGSGNVQLNLNPQPDA